MTIANQAHKRSWKVPDTHLTINLKRVYHTHAMKYPSFWDNLQKPIIGLAPMDGVTDAPCRTIHGLYGRPDMV
ncbi:MAG: hypothetical protein ACXVCM_07205, partial [Ktedonobacteraceae bacterium]